MQITFNSNGKNYHLNADDAIMDNGARIQFIKGMYKNNPHADSVLLPTKEWERIKPLLKPITYEEYYGRKPLLNGITMYVIKN